MTDVLHPEPGATQVLLELQPVPAAAGARARTMAGRFGAATLAAASLVLLGAVAADVVSVTFTAGDVSRTVFEQRGFETPDGQILAGLAAFSLLVALLGWYRRGTRWLLLSLPTTVMAVVAGAVDIPRELDGIARANHQMAAAGVPVHGAPGAGTWLWVIGAAGMVAATVLAIIRR